MNLCIIIGYTWDQVDNSCSSSRDGNDQWQQDFLWQGPGAWGGGVVQWRRIPEKFTEFNRLAMFEINRTVPSVTV